MYKFTYVSFLIRFIFKVKILKPIKVWKLLLSRGLGKNFSVSSLLYESFDLRLQRKSSSYDINTITVLGKDLNIRDLDWNADFVSSHVYEKIRFDKLKYTRYYNKGIEVKYPWELSRFHFGINYVDCFRCTGDELYYEKFKSLVYNWDEQNPYLYGINWTCTMEVAIRAINWIFTCSLFGDIFFNDESFKHFISNRLYEHANYISAFPEIVLNGPSNNHLATDYCGLFVIASFLECSKSKQWKKQAVNGLEDCISSQILSDGCDFECSIPYHRLITEIFFIPALMDFNNTAFSKKYYSLLFRMLEFVEAYVDQKGNAPQMGDNDSGIIIPFSRHNNQKHGYLLEIGSALFDYNFRIPKDSELLISPLIKHQYSISDLLTKPRIKVSPKCFCEGGYYIIRNQKCSLVVYSPCKSRNSGHRHCDSANFTFSLKGEPIIVDPGTGSYTANMQIRNQLRMEFSHNVYCSLSDLVCENSNDDCFNTKIKYESRVVYFDEQKLVVVVSKKGVDILKRTFELTSNNLFIYDEFFAYSFDYKGYIHFIHDIKVVDEYFFVGNTKVHLSGGLNICKEFYNYSSIYGCIEKKECISYTPTKNVNLAIYFQ